MCVYVCIYIMEVNGHQKLFGCQHSSDIFCVQQNRNSHKFKTTWVWVNKEMNLIFKVNHPFNTINLKPDVIKLDVIFDIPWSVFTITLYEKKPTRNTSVTYVKLRVMIRCEHSCLFIRNYQFIKHFLMKSGWKKQRQYSAKVPRLCSIEDTKSYNTGIIWERVNDDRIFYIILSC